MDPHFDGVIFKTSSQELERRMRFEHPPYLLIDVREAAERSSGSIAGSVALDAGGLEALPEGSSASTEFIVVGSDQYDPRVRDMAQRLRELGAQRVVELPGGMFEWHAAGAAVVIDGE
ncbi:MAG: rhodanese-like domain-containing protein [Acidobacteriota bacterium]|nr:rhodanese-like domain-containing protein [Acidobacteriota bacterium]